MTDHWDHDDFDYDLPDDAHHDVTPELPDLDHPGLDHADLDHQLETPDPHLPHVPDLPDPTGTELPDVPDTLGTAAADLFPPALDVDLPEPVDGFPWVDTATLGAPDLAGFVPPVDAVTPAELAAHAGIEIPPGADAWSFLASSEDPATAALARWWTTTQQP